MNLSRQGLERGQVDVGAAAGVCGLAGGGEEMLADGGRGVDVRHGIAESINLISNQGNPAQDRKGSRTFQALVGGVGRALHGCQRRGGTLASGGGQQAVAVVDDLTGRNSSIIDVALGRQDVPRAKSQRPHQDEPTGDQRSAKELNAKLTEKNDLGDAAIGAATPWRRSGWSTTAVAVANPVAVLLEVVPPVTKRVEGA